ncbi:hypothetical protein D3C76_1523900 [compost metagenome]
MCGGVEGHWHAPIRPRQPAAIDQQPQAAGLIVERLQQLDASAAITQAVIQQQAVLAVKTAMQLYPVKRRIGQLLNSRHGQRRLDAAFGIGIEQHAFFIGPAQLPAAERNQPRQQR